MNQNVGKLDPIQMQRKVYDEQIEANRVTVVGTEMGIELSAQDGDSVYAIPLMTVHNVQAGDVIDTSMAKRMNVVSGPVDASMIILGEVLSLGTVSGIKEICSPAIKFESDCIVVLQG